MQASNPSSTQNSVGKPAESRRYQNTAARVSSEPMAKSALPVCGSMHVLHAAYRTGQYWQWGFRFVSLPRRCIHVHDRFPLQPQHWNSARSWLTCLVARHSGPCRRRMRVNEFSLHRGISRPVCRLVLEFCIMIGDAMSGCHVDRRRLAVLACM